MVMDNVAAGSEQEVQRIKTRWAALVEGFKPLGVVVSSKIAAFPSSFGTGIQALENIDKGDIVVTVPLTAMVTHERLRRHYKTALVLPPTDTPNWSLFASYFARIRSKIEVAKSVSTEFKQIEVNNVKWFPDCLSALSFDEELLAELPPWTASYFRAYQDAVETEYNFLAKLAKEKTPYGISLEAFKEGVCLALSRAFAIDRGELAIIPVCDIFNHRATSPDLDANFNITHFWFVATRNISPGEEIFDSYGKRDGVKTLKDYGFVDLPSDRSSALKSVIQLRLDLPTPDARFPFFLLKRSLVERFGGKVGISDRGVSRESLNVVKLVLSEDPTVDFARLETLIDKEEIFISKANDDSARKYLSDLCKQQLSLLVKNMSASKDFETSAPWKRHLATEARKLREYHRKLLESCAESPLTHSEL